MTHVDYEGDFTLTSGDQTFRLPAQLKNIVGIWVQEYNIAGVEVAGNGIPTHHSYYLGTSSLSMVDRASSDLPTGHDIPLTLTGELSQRRFETPILMTSPDERTLAFIRLTLRKPDGTLATFTRATVHLVFTVFKAEVSLAKAISLKPSIIDTLNQRARPWIL